MTESIVVAICISPEAGAPMQKIETVEAIAGAGLQGDRYAKAEGSFNRGRPGKRQVTLINAKFFSGSGFEYLDCRRNIIASGVELMWLIGKEFRVGTALFRGVMYCDPCTRPNKLGGEKLLSAPPFKEAFHELGGLIAEITEGGMISVGCKIIPPPKGY